MTMSELRSTSVNLGVQLMLNVIVGIQSGNVKPVPQPKESPTVKARRVKPGQYHSIIRWEKCSSERIARLFTREVVRLEDLFPEAAAHFRWN